MSEFNRDDVIAVAKAVLDCHMSWNEGYTNSMNAHDGYVCAHCGDGQKPETQKEEDFVHGIDCAVLVARDLLTGVDISDIED